MIYYEINKETVKNLLVKRDENTNKGSFGKVLNIAGCNNYIGAAYLSSISALKSGCGLVSLLSTPRVIKSVSSYCPDITYEYLLSQSNPIFAEINSIKSINIIKNYDVISIGCGLSDKSNVCLYFKRLLDKIKKLDKPIVIDADGLNIIAKREIKLLLNRSIITPHPMELSRLLKVDIEKIQKNRVESAIIASKKYNCITVLKGHKSIITDGKKVYINTSGTNALAKAGSGDILTGLISGFLAQLEKLNKNSQNNLLEACILGVFIHGLTGEVAAKSLSNYSVLASDLIKYIGQSIRELK